MAEIQTDNLIHIKIDEAITKRGEILTCAKDTIQILKQYEEFKKLREEKEKTQNKFLLLTKEIAHLIRKLKVRELPKVEAEKEAAEKKPKKGKKKGKKVKREPTITEQLDKELQEIQEKISTLEI